MKPANILVSCSDCSVKIADFGLSRVVESNKSGENVVVEGEGALASLIKANSGINQLRGAEDYEKRFLMENGE